MSKRTLSSDRGPLALANDEFTLLNDLSLGDSESDDEDYTPLLEVEDGSDDSYEDVESDGDDNVSISNASDDGEDDFGNNDDDDNDDNESDNESVHSYTEHWEDAYHTDTSDEEELRNTVGNIPLEWYDDYPHIGYDLDGKKILKPAQGDQLDEFLKKMDDPNYWRTVTDKISGKEIILTDEDIDLIQNIQRSQYPENSSNPYEPYVDLYSHEKMIHPVMDRPESKRRFLPSLWERKKIMKLVQGIKSGRIKPVKKPEKPKVYMLWSEQQMDNLRPHQYVPAPKVRLPGHGESYNPPPEYLPTKEEQDEWESTDLKERKHFIPTKYESLLSVPAYRYFIHERFNRCLDLYLCPRQTRMRIQVEPEDLIPKLPRPRDLQPFPAVESIVYEGHSGMVRSISIDKSGQWLASVSDDETLKLWEVQTGRCLKTIALKGRPACVEFSPNASMSLLSVAVGNNIILINHGLGDRLVTIATDSALNSTSDDPTVEGSSSIEWNDCMDTDGYSNGIRITIVHSQVVNQVTWHCKGDYCGTVIGGDGSSTVFIHQLSKKKSQNPFKTSKGLVQKVLFHPSKPLFFVATQTYIRIYNLIKQELVKKLLPGVKWISSIAIHPQGDNIIVGSYDKKLSWMDMDLSTKPYKILRHHRQAIRHVCFHQVYPLFASCSDDNSAIVCHGMVYNDLMQNPLIVPVKVLRGHSSVDTLGVLSCVFHPHQPWLFTAGADSTIKLYT